MAYVNKNWGQINGGDDATDDDDNNNDNEWNFRLSNSVELATARL